MLSEEQRARLTARLRKGRDQVAPEVPRGPLVAMNTGDGPPLYAFHAIAGTVYGYAPLVRELTGTYRVFGVEAAGLTPGTGPAKTLAEMVNRYADALCQAQPDGPFRLLGWSMGGVLAFETAVRLEVLGREVALVVIVDASYRTGERWADSEEGLAALFVADASRLLGGGPAPAAGVRPDSVADQLDSLAARLADGTDGLDEVRADLDRRFAVFRTHTEAYNRYLPRATVKADGIVIGAAGSPDEVADWESVLTGTVRTFRSAGDHYTCLIPPAVGEIAAPVRAAIGGYRD